MNESLLNTADDLAWLKDTHYPQLPDDVKCVHLFGNEDSPDSLRLYKSAEPLIADEYVEVKLGQVLSYWNGSKMLKANLEFGPIDGMFHIAPNTGIPDSDSVFLEDADGFRYRRVITGDQTKWTFMRL